MHVSRYRQLDSLLLWVVVPFLGGALTATLGSYWDDAWHTNRGRDSFFIPPHLLIYGGVLVAGTGLGLWVAREIVRRGRTVLRRDRAVAMAALGVCATMMAAPIDNLWHTTFGRDAVLWSPPHVLGIVGLVSLSVALLVLVGRRSGRWVAPAQALLGGAALTAANFLVVEYETDVPQFNERYYLPALALITVIIFSLLRSADAGRWTASIAALVNAVLVGLAAAFLLSVGWEAPLLPLLVGPALVFDVGDRRRWAPALRVVAHVVALYALYVPWVNWAHHGVHLSAGAIVSGLPLALAATAAGLWVLRRRPQRAQGRSRTGRGARAGLAALLSALVVVYAAPNALAHDPGQGVEIARMDQLALVARHRVDVRGRIVRGSCRRLRADGLAARRAHRVRHGLLRQQGCAYRGTITLPGRGRWFVYFDLRRGRQAVESWLPVKLEDGQRRFVERSRSVYLPNQSPNGAAKTVGTVALYVLIVALILATARLVEDASNSPAPRVGGPRTAR